MTRGSDKKPPGRKSAPDSVLVHSGRDPHANHGFVNMPQSVINTRKDG